MYDRIPNDIVASPVEEWALAALVLVLWLLGLVIVYALGAGWRFTLGRWKARRRPMAVYRRAPRGGPS